MEVTIKTPDEIAARAKARGLKVEAYIEEILALHLEAQPSETRRPQTPTDTSTNLATVFENIAKDVLDSDWARVRSDLSTNLDHHLYRPSKAS